MSTQLSQIDRIIYSVAYNFRDIVIQNPIDATLTKVPVMYSQQSKRKMIDDNINLRDARVPENKLEINIPVPLLCVNLTDLQPDISKMLPATNVMSGSNQKDSFVPQPHIIEIELLVVTANANQFYTIYEKIKPLIHSDISYDIRIGNDAFIEEITLKHTSNTIDIPSVLDAGDQRLMYNSLMFSLSCNLYSLPDSLPDASEYKFVYENINPASSLDIDFEIE